MGTVAIRQLRGSFYPIIHLSSNYIFLCGHRNHPSAIYLHVPQQWFIFVDLTWIARDVTWYHVSSQICIVWSCYWWYVTDYGYCFSGYVKNSAVFQPWRHYSTEWNREKESKHQQDVIRGRSRYSGKRRNVMTNVTSRVTSHNVWRHMIS